MPAEAKGTTEKSAKAFVRYYVSSVNHAMKTGDTQALLDASARSCESCGAVADNIGGVYADGGRLRGKGWRLTAMKPVASQPQANPIVQTGVFVNQQVKVARTGAKPEHFGGGQQLMTFFLEQRRGTWLVQKWDQTK